MKGKKETIKIKGEDLPKRRRTWEIKPITKIKESDKVYKRDRDKKKKEKDWEE